MGYGLREKDLFAAPGQAGRRQAWSRLTERMKTEFCIEYMAPSPHAFSGGDSAPRQGFGPPPVPK